jgi:flagellar motor switch protein FliN
MADNRGMPPDVRTILRLQVPVIVQIGRRSIPMSEVLAFGPGAILELDKSSEEELDLLVKNKRIGKGTAVKVGENFGIRITTIESPRHRVAALG